jgi:predicted CXXCH cytochrome family protein
LKPLEKSIVLIAAAAIFLCAAAVPSSSSPRIRILAPAEESFMGQEEILIIGSVQGEENGTEVRIMDNGRMLGTAPLKGSTFTFRAKLSDGRHEILFSISGVPPKTIKVFVGRQEGYRYHIARDGSSCSTCHPEADGNRFSVGFMQADMCSQCHDPIRDTKHVHGPVAAGSCTPCHDPHGSRYPKYLVSSGKELCLVCHIQTLSMKHVGGRENADCVKCHDPHGSDRDYQLRQ